MWLFCECGYFELPSLQEHVKFIIVEFRHSACSGLGTSVVVNNLASLAILQFPKIQNIFTSIYYNFSVTNLKAWSWAAEIVRVCKKFSQVTTSLQGGVVRPPG